MSYVRPTSAEETLREVDAFFMKSGSVHDTLRKLVRRLAKEQIDYAIIGGMALALHGFIRPTRDIDLLMTREGLDQFSNRMAGLGYVPAFPGARKHFRDTETGVPIEIIVAGEYPGDGKPKSVAFPDPADASVEMGEYRVVDIASLIELKLASGLSAEHRLLRDLADVQQLIETLHLPPDLAQQLDESVRGEYERLWHLAQRTREESSEP